jgi:hypothetical protein
MGRRSLAEAPRASRGSTRRAQETDRMESRSSKWGRNGFDGIVSLCEGVSGSELP